MHERQQTGGGVAKSPTGIKGLDEITLGGLPTGRPTLICGSAGCGKTLFGVEFLVRGVQFGEAGVCVTFEERVEDVIANVASLGFDLPPPSPPSSSASTTSSLIAPCLTDKGIALQDVYLGPAGVLTGSAQLAQEAHEEAEEQQQRYEIAQLVRLDDLVQDYLSLVRVNQMQLQPQDLGVYIQSWGTEMQVRAATPGITLQLEGVESLGQVVFHASTLRRVVFNLVQNALDATPNGGTVSLAGQGTATQVQLQVRDMGSGIPAERLERIFEPLYTTKPGGTGLGLYIVQEIVTAHGGQITVQSIEGQGTTFSITLPRVPAEAPVPAGFPDPRITLGRSEYGMGEQDTDGPGHYPRMRQSTPARRRRGHQEGGWHVGRRPIHTIRG